MATRARKQGKPAEGEVEIELAHHWTDRRDPEKPVRRKAGETITVPAEVARSLVSAGYVRVDADDPDAVRAALGAAAPAEPAGK